MKPFILFFLWMHIPAWMIAQSLNDTLQIREVEIIAVKKTEETGLKISRPDSMAVASELTTDLSELLSLHTPVFIKSYGRGSQATASFRGTASSHTQLVWNGMNLNSPMAGFADLSLLPVFFIDDITLLHGGSSLAGSSGALGGSIHLENSPQWDVRQLFSGIVEFASFQSQKYMARLQTGNSRLQSVTRFLHDTSENTFPFYNVGVIPYRTDTLRNAGYSKTAVLQELYYRFPDQLFTSFRFWYQNNERDLPQLMSYEGNRRVEFQHDHQWRAQIEIKKYIDHLNYRFFSGLNHSRLHYFRQIPDIEYVIDDAVSIEYSWFNRFKINNKINSKLSFTGDVEANYHWVESMNKVRDTGYGKERMEAGMLLHLQYQPSKRSGLFLLSRTEYYDGRIIPLIPSAGAEWQLSANHPWIMKGNVTRNYHKPSLNDLYWIPGGNSALLPEKGTTGEVSFSSESKNRFFLFRNEISLFLSKIDNWIIWQPATNGAWFWEASNLKKVLSRGMEYDFNSRIELENWKFRMGGNYAYTRTTNQNAAGSVDQSRGKQLIYIPMHSGNLHFSAIIKKWSFMTVLNYTGRRYTQSSNQWSYFESVLNPFWLTSASVQREFTIKKLEIRIKAKAENLFDSNYQQILWRPMPGRNYSLNLSAGYKR